MVPLNLKNKQLHWIPADLPIVDFKEELIRDFSSEFVADTAKAFQSQRLTIATQNYETSTWIENLTDSQKKLKEYIEKF